MIYDYHMELQTLDVSKLSGGRTVQYIGTIQWITDIFCGRVQGRIGLYLAICNQFIDLARERIKENTRGRFFICWCWVNYPVWL